jgi:hypothetical protein
MPLWIRCAPRRLAVLGVVIRADADRLLAVHDALPSSASYRRHQKPRGTVVAENMSSRKNVKILVTQWLGK